LGTYHVPNQLFEIFCVICFFFQAEDGIRDRNVTGVQTCALPICIEANIEKCQSYVDKSLGVITALNPHIGYKKATKIAKEALETEASIRDLILRDNILSEEEIDRILNPFEMTKPGIAGK